MLLRYIWISSNKINYNNVEDKIMDVLSYIGYNPEKVLPLIGYFIYIFWIVKLAVIVFKDIKCQMHLINGTHVIKNTPIRKENKESKVNTIKK